MPKISPKDIESGSIVLRNGQTISFDGDQLQDWMGERGMNIEDAADTAQALAGLFTWIRINEYREDEADARAALALANQKMFDSLKNVPGVGGELSKAFQAQCEAQQNLDKSQSLINRAEDASILVASGSAAAKLLLRDKGGAFSGFGSEQMLLAGTAAWLGYQMGDGRTVKSSKMSLEETSTVPK